MSLAQRNAYAPARFEKSVEQGSTEFVNKEEEGSDAKSQDSLGKEEREKEGYETKSQEAEASLDEVVVRSPKEIQEVSTPFGNDLPKEGQEASLPEEVPKEEVQEVSVVFHDQTTL